MTPSRARATIMFLTSSCSGPETLRVPRVVCGETADAEGFRDTRFEAVAVCLC
jgi:hypothetical protein